MQKTGGGFFFHLLHCDRCGAEASVGFDEIPDIHAGYLKGSGVPYTVASAAQDEAIRDAYEGDALTEGEYHLAVEEHAGSCECRGHFRFAAPARCPQCASDKSTPVPGGSEAMYD